MTQTANRLYTVDEYIKLPQYHERYELIDGRLVEKPMPKYEHSVITDIFKEALLKFDPEKKLGVMRSEVSIRLRSDYSPTPDLSYWVAERVPERKVAIAPIPDLAIEIQSPDQSITELTKKAKNYIQAGIRLVWVVQPNRKLVAVFRYGSDKPVTIQPSGELDGEDVIPNFKLPVSTLFEDED